MSRPLRIEYKGALYHVFARGNERRDIFFGKRDKAVFLRTLSEMCTRFEIDIYAFILMDNHYHLLLRTRQPNLSRSMQWFGGTYVRRFNIRHHRSGHLFQGRFRSILVENTAYMLRLSCYIHRNPLRAKIVDRLASYRWSSYVFYAYGSRKKPKWLKIRPILSHIRSEDKHKAYREMVQKYSEEEKSIWEDVKHGVILGSKRFVNHVKKKYLSAEFDEAIPEQRMICWDTDLGELVTCATKLLKRDINEFTSHARIPLHLKSDRDLLIYFLWETGFYTNREIGDLFNLHYSSINKRVKKFKNTLNQKSNEHKQLQRLKSLIQL